jgi:hypothetical protein
MKNKLKTIQNSTFLLIVLAFASSCKLSSNKIIKANDKAVAVTAEEESVLTERFNANHAAYTFNDSTRIECADFNTEECKVSICAFNDMNTDSSLSHYAFVTLEKNGEKISDTLNQERTVFVNSLNLSFDIYKDQFFIAWIAENPDKNIPSSLYIECFDIKTKKKLFQHKVYEQKWGIMRLAVKFDPFTNSVLFAYNDFNEADSKYLFLGSLSLDELMGSNPKLKPVSILNEDQTEKRMPAFIRTDSVLFLYHTSGDTWGAMERTGKQGVGLSRIDKNNMPADYRTIADKNMINEEILILHDTLFYQHVIGKNKGEFDIKKIALRDIAREE